MLDRLGRSLRALIHLVGELENSGVGVAKPVLDYAAKVTGQEQIVERIEDLEKRTSEDSFLRRGVT